MARIYLVGFMAVGKSTIGKRLAEMLNYEVIDLDDIFEKKYKISIKTFFNKYDENLFRNLESDLLKTTFEVDDVVISTGGGTPCFFNSIDLMNENGITVYLEMSIPALVERLKHAKRPRPLVDNKKTESLSEFVTQTLEARKPAYQKAQVKVSAEDIDYEDLCSKIKDIL